MMEKAVKQRLVGGLVLIAGAALFLPMLLEGTGADLTAPPIPTPPVVAGVEELQPKLDKDIQAANQAVDEAQAGPVFHEVVPVAPETAVEETPPDEAYKLAESPVAPAAAVVTAPAVKPVAAPDKQAVTSLAADKAATEAARVAAQKAVAERLAREKAETERLAAEKKALAAKQRAAQQVVKPVVASPAAAPASTKPAANLPQAWVVQVASLSARDKADELVARLRSKGYRATLVHQSGMWKVLVGPELRKEVAESIKQRLAADTEFHLSGWVQAWKP